MSKSQFDKRYSIEYLQPGKSTSAPKKKGVYIVISLLLIISSFTTVLWMKGFLDQYLPTVSINDKINFTLEADNISDDKPLVNSIKKTAKEHNDVINKDKKTINMVKQVNTSITSTKSKSKSLDADKQLLEDRLKKITDQLNNAKRSNTTLSEKLIKNLELSKNLSTLYENAANDANESDQEFIKIIEKDRTRTDKRSVSDKNKTPQQPVSELIANTTSAQEIEAKGSGKNTVEFTTSNQMDKIITTIEGHDNVNERLEPSTSNPSPEAIKMSIGIQSRINALVDANISPTTAFTKALVGEDQVRKNAVRSVIVRKGETLWSIAKRAYGKGHDFPKILKANPKLRKGKVVMLYIGQVIRVPKD